MAVITYHVTLLEPTLVTELDGDPNSAVAFDYLPGSVLRGAIISKYLQTCNLTDLAVDDTARLLFFDGKVRYLNGYRLDRQGYRSLPVPQSWQREKGDEQQAYDFAIEEPPEDPENKRQWQGIRAPFCSSDGNEATLVKTDRHIAVHTARTRRFGRAMPQNKIDKSKGDTPGAVYRYEALAAGQTFEAVILCDEGADVGMLRRLVTGEATLGGSRSGGYGRVRFQCEEPGSNEEEAGPWREVSGTLTPKANDKLIVTLLSDALLRDTNGQFAVNSEVVREELKTQLDCNLDPPQSFMRGRVIGGFNRKWGLPLPQALAVRMGSVFVFDTPDCDENMLRALEWRGVGERRVEGFGRVAINWHTEPILEVDRTLPIHDSTSHMLSPGSESAKLAQRMVKRLLRLRLDERVVEGANTTSVSRPPSKAQLARLRNIIHDELMRETPNPSRVKTFLTDIKKRSTARKQFELARVGSKPLLNWLEDKLNIISEQDLKNLLSFQALDTRKIGNVEPEFPVRLRNEYLLRFIDAVLARAAKQDREEN